MLKDAMSDALSSENLLGKRGDPGLLAMNVNIIEYRKGDAFRRWLWRGWGFTVLVIEASLMDEKGNVDAIAQVNRSIEMDRGFTIGAWQAIFDSVAADPVASLSSAEAE